MTDLQDYSDPSGIPIDNRAPTVTTAIAGTGKEFAYCELSSVAWELTRAKQLLKTILAMKTTSPNMDFPPSSKESALTKLEREAEQDSSNDINDIDLKKLVHPSYCRSAMEMREWRYARPMCTYTPVKRGIAEMQGLDHIFPQIQGKPRKRKLNCWKEYQLGSTGEDREPENNEKAGAFSDMGLFGSLPGELRNHIYRIAFVPPAEEQPLIITGSDLVCGTGECVHRKATTAAPAMASTCRQIRQEIMPIFCAENSFKFDTVMVRNRCVGNWIKAMNTYAHFISEFVLEVMVLDRDWITGGTSTSIQQVFVQCPAGRDDGRFAVSFSDQMPKCAVRDSKIKKFVEKLNDGEPRGRGSMMAFVGQSDELAELVYRCRKYR